MKTDESLLEEQQIVALFQSINQPFKQGRTKSNVWSKFENDLLTAIIAQYGPKHWSFIAQKFNQSSERQRSLSCIVQHWVRVLDPSISSRKWTNSEDTLLMNLLQSNATRQWKAIAAQLNGRTDTQVINRLKVLRNSKVWEEVPRHLFP